jgi:hypothetical protein
MVAWLLLLTDAGRAPAVEALRPSLADMAKQVARLLAGQNEDAIAVGAFTGPSHTPASAGPGIKRVFIEELEKQKVHVRNRAKLEIKGDYRDVMDKNSQVLALRLKATVLDNQGEALVVLDKKIEDRDVLAQVLGLTRSDPGAGLTPQKESTELKKRMDEPRVDLTDTRVRADRRSPYAVEILTKERGQYQPVRAAANEGFAFVPLGKSQVFAVKLINDSDHDAAVELTLDGLSMFAFSENKGYRHILVPKKSNTLIKGWHRNNMLSDEFVITDYSKSAAAQLLNSVDSIGTITATFAAAWDPKEKPPVDEGAKFRDPFNPAVGRGDPVQTPYKEVVRQRGRVRDVISVRYKKPMP